MSPHRQPSGRPPMRSGVLLVTYGSAGDAEEVPAYLRSVRGGREPAPELVAEFTRRYQLVGWSPLIRITRAQAAALQERLNLDAGDGGYLVEAAMLHSEPHVGRVAQRLVAAGAERLLGVVLSPQYSPIIMGGYGRALRAAAADAGLDPDEPGRVQVAGAWHGLPAFLDALTERVRQALARLPGDVPVIFTAHSLPKRVVDREPGYIDQLKETAEALAKRAELDSQRWQFAYQSAGHTPEEWLKPDLKDLLPGLRTARHQDVLVVPVQFLADHLEILYDLDVAARQEAEAAGVGYHRIELLNTDPGFIRALVEVVHREEQAAATPAG
jgi:ferrochelatase